MRKILESYGIYSISDANWVLDKILNSADRSTVKIKFYCPKLLHLPESINNTFPYIISMNGQKMTFKKTINRPLSRKIEQDIIFWIFLTTLKKIKKCEKCLTYIYGNIEMCNQCYIFNQMRDHDISNLIDVELEINNLEINNKLSNIDDLNKLHKNRHLLKKYKSLPSLVVRNQSIKRLMLRDNKVLISVKR